MHEYKKQLDFLQEKYRAGQLGHAYLLSGLEGGEFAENFTKFIYCQEAKKPCQVCRTCVMVEKGIFPDAMVVKSAADNLEIDVSQIRAAQNFLSFTSYYGNYKVLLVENAERMNQEAQNCFLKTLEEPRGKTVIFLNTKNPHRLLSTILSRCQEIKFAQEQSLELSPKEEEVVRRFQNAVRGGFSEKFKYAKAENLEEGRFGEMLVALQKYFRKLLLEKVQGKESDTSSVEKVKNTIRLIDDIAYKSTITNINNKLALEILLLEL